MSEPVDPVVVQVREAASLQLCLLADRGDRLVSFPFDSFAELPMLIFEVRFEPAELRRGLFPRGVDDLPGLLLCLVEHRLQRCFGLKKSAELSDRFGPSQSWIGFSTSPHSHHPRNKVSEHR